MKLNLKQLEYFIAVAEERSISMAARLLDTGGLRYQLSAPFDRADPRQFWHLQQAFAGASSQIIPCPYVERQSLLR